MVLSSSTRHVSVSVMNRQPIGSKGWPTQPSRLVVEVTPLWRSSKIRKGGRESEVNLTVLGTPTPELHSIHKCAVSVTFLLVFVDVHLSLLLQAESVNNGDGQSQGFPGVTMRAQGVNACTRCRDVICGVDREMRWGAFSQHFFFFLHSCPLLQTTHIHSLRW